MPNCRLCFRLHLPMQTHNSKTFRSQFLQIPLPTGWQWHFTSAHHERGTEWKGFALGRWTLTFQHDPVEIEPLCANWGEIPRNSKCHQEQRKIESERMRKVLRKSHALAQVLKALLIIAPSHSIFDLGDYLASPRSASAVQAQGNHRSQRRRRGAKCQALRRLSELSFTQVTSMFSEGSGFIVLLNSVGSSRNCGSIQFTEMLEGDRKGAVISCAGECRHLIGTASARTSRVCQRARLGLPAFCLYDEWNMRDTLWTSFLCSSFGYLQCSCFSSRHATICKQGFPEL